MNPIAEQHAVNVAAGMACDGLKPVVAIYSTFLQRGYDQVVHDVAIQSLPVRFAIDRAGLVGADGATHAGTFDNAYLGCLPNMVIMAASDEAEMVHMVATQVAINDRPSALRYPRGEGRGVEMPEVGIPLPVGKGRIVREGKHVGCCRSAPASPSARRPPTSSRPTALRHDRRCALHEALWFSSILKEAHRRHGPKAPSTDVESLGLSRILHTLGTAVKGQCGGRPAITRSALIQTEKALGREERDWLDSLGLSLGGKRTAAAWGSQAIKAAFEHLGKAIVRSGHERVEPPKNALREDEIVWGRAPARLDLGGGWTDTPPYSLERGGCVINAAVDLNGQAPIQAYARVIEKPEIRINSIDHSVRVVVKTLEELLDYRRPGSQFALAKAALALSGFDREAAALYRYLATGDIQGIEEPVNIQARRARALAIGALVTIRRRRNPARRRTDCWSMSSRGRKAGPGAQTSR